MPPHHNHQPTIYQDLDERLLKAVKDGNDSTFKLLLEAGADKEAKDDVRDERGGGGGVVGCVCMSM